MPQSDLDEAIKAGKEKALDREADVLIYENEGSNIRNDFTVTLSRWGMPKEFPELGRTYKVVAEIFFEDGTSRVSLAPSVKNETSSSNDLYEGREVLVVFEEGETEKTKVEKLSERQVKTKNGMKFKRSDLTAGWGTEPSKLELEVQSGEGSISENDLDWIGEGDEVLTSEEEVVEVTAVTSRQIKTSEENYRKSDGKVWGGGEKELVKRLTQDTQMT